MLDAVIGIEGVRRWEALVAALPTGPLYHGTSLARAEPIMAHGFQAAFGRLVEDRAVETYWGRPATAATFAYRGAVSDHSPPAIIAATLDAVLASGEPMALRRDCDDVDDDWSTWRECHEATGALRVRGGRHVAAMLLHRI